jgi:imidazolonepropionase-like amidohydrolase
MKAIHVIAAALLLPLHALAGTTAIVGGTVAVGDGSAPIAGGTVVIRDGRILAAGADVKVPQGASIVDAQGKWVSPGLIAAYTQLGIGSFSRVAELNDSTAAESPFSAALDVSTAVNPDDAPIQVSRAEGITRAVVVPFAGKTIFGGQGAVIDLSKRTDVIMRPRAFQYVELGAQADHPAGGSRPAAYAYLHEALEEARDYEHPSEAKATPPWHEVLTRADAAALVQILEGKQPLLVHVNRASDIRHVLALRQSYPHVRLILLGAREGWRVAGEIAAAHVPVIASVGDLPDNFDSLASTESNVGRMVRAGVTVAVSIQGVSLEAYTRVLAAGLVAITKEAGATGLDWGQAFATITSKPAEVLGLEGEIGSLRPGRHADVVIWDGDPLEVVSAPVVVYIDGLPQPLDNHLTKLRDRYRQVPAGALPKSYEHQ